MEGKILLFNFRFDVQQYGCIWLSLCEALILVSFFFFFLKLFIMTFEFLGWNKVCKMKF